jgi:hypothetical protein
MQRIRLKYTEDKKQQLILLAQHSANTVVVGEYYKGCELVKYTNGKETKLIVS